MKPPKLQAYQNSAELHGYHMDNLSIPVSRPECGPTTQSLAEMNTKFRQCKDGLPHGQVEFLIHPQP
jgi:hypothetical protein